jgi:hypothetical protein
MNEDFLQYIWKFQQFISFDLCSTEGEQIQVVQPGRHNQDAGPDFLDAKVRIGDTLWAGNVEVHISASDWNRHNHQADPAYDNVVLHVVYSADTDIFTKSGFRIPTLCIRDLFDFQSYRFYKSWLKAPKFIACENMIREVPSIVKSTTVESSAISRIRKKAGICLDHLQHTKGDIEGSFYRILLRSLGLKVNAIPFEQLSLITPFSLVQKVRHNRTDLEALFLGQAGFLAKGNKIDHYVKELDGKYEFLRAKYSLEPMPVSAWKLLRLRPQNFPPVRLAQLASIYSRHDSLTDRISETEHTAEISKLFGVQLNDPFWLHHYTLDKESTSATKHIGEDTIDLLIINAVVPFLFALSYYNRDERWKEKAVRFLEELPAETNSVTKRFSSFGFKIQSALDSQGILHLKQFLCEPKKCLNCKIGIHLMKDYDNTGKIHQELL